MHNPTRELPSPTHDDTSGYNSDAAGLRSRRKQISARAALPSAQHLHLQSLDAFRLS
ncbi:hypothetical protein F2Q70_00031397 [Brassica cretica]|uniref:Uncharacterized protein n=2 Tax=Brassica cretica TaxID=69181 RepID=A0A8S9N722_BRACR|nr:hypothetical protein F2Q70_00031397 [Brassica cretica]KAF3488444.1 hypothetical protein F2Q69_00055370 [Brassica cretica]KAF3595063.1 hypothetical protein DY000_02024576 [Brassica cretica]